MRAVRGFTELINPARPRELDFADVRTVMERGGRCHDRHGESDSDDKAADSVKKRSAPRFLMSISPARLLRW
jgi:cell division protein FtsZ